MPLKMVVQVVTMKAVMDVLLADHFERPLTIPETLEVAKAIDILWDHKDDTWKASLHALVPPEALAKLIPAWESQWRVIFYALMELFRHPPSSPGMSVDNINGYISETLRLYPPVKRVHRRWMWMSYSYDIANKLRSYSIWGESAETFNPARESSYTDEQKLAASSMARCAFGMGELKCIANKVVAEKFCGAVADTLYQNITYSGDEWQEIEQLPVLENKRGLYGDLCVSLNHVLV